jgi:hypothetical protein
MGNYVKAGLWAKRSKPQEGELLVPNVGDAPLGDYQEKLTAGLGVFIDNHIPDKPVISGMLGTGAGINMYTRNIPDPYDDTKQITVPFFAANTKEIVATEVDTEELRALVTNGALIPGVLYIISGVAPMLYDDGNGLGTTIYLTALTTSKLATQGFGLFHNPIYNRSEPGFGIFTNLCTNVTIDFPYSSDYCFGGDTMTMINGTGGEAMFLGNMESKILKVLSGDWHQGTHFSTLGTSPGLNNATIMSLTKPNYIEGQRVIWGGYVWRNSFAGDGGIPISDTELDPTIWVKLPYVDASVYKVALDVIEFDYTNMFITRRYSPVSGNDVNQEYAPIGADPNIPVGVANIALMQWGNGMNDGLSVGVASNIVKSNGLLNCVNFRGSIMLNNKVAEESVVDNTVFTNGVVFSGNILNMRSRLVGSQFCGGEFSRNTFHNLSKVSDYYSVYTNTIGNTYINETSVHNNNINNSSLSLNTFDNTSVVGTNIVRAEINGNHCRSSEVGDLVLKLAENFINDNSLYGSTLTGLRGDNFSFSQNTLIHSQLSVPAVNIHGKNLDNLTMTGSVVFNLTGLEILFTSTSCSIIRASNMLMKLVYMNDAGVYVALPVIQ